MLSVAACLAMIACSQASLDAAEAASTERGLTSTLAMAGGDAQGGAPVQIGDTLRWRVVVDDPEHVGATLDDAAAFQASDALGLAWAVLEGPAPFDLPGADLALEWLLLPLESGTQSVPPLAVTFTNGARATVPEASVEVVPALLQEEDEARPLPGFREVASRHVGSPAGALLAAVLLLALPLAFYALRLRRGAAAGGGTATHNPTAEDQLHALFAEATDRAAAGGTADGGSPAQTLARLGPLVRRVVDQRDGVSRASLTDAEWSDALGARDAERPGPDQVAALVGAVKASSDVRFAGAEPTPFALRESLDAVQAALTDWPVVPPEARP